ncbi:MAG TPA: phosphodiesterase [Erysipelotrichaceae bacterium]|nr:phosphodiesterase [Erysipelotrichaceae bacterium]
MTDLNKAVHEMNLYLENCPEKGRPGFRLKTVHTYHVMRNAGIIAEAMRLSEEDIQLAKLIGLLHDIGRFEELIRTGMLANERFDHGMCGAQMLFEDGMIRRFIEEDTYDEIIRKAIVNHNRFHIEEGLNERELLHAKLIRDADKLDNFRVKIDEPIHEIFPGRISSIEEINASCVSENVMKSIRKRQCVDVHDRLTPLDYMICIVGFVFDFNFDVTKKIVRDEKLAEKFLERITCINEKGKEQMREITDITLAFLAG